MGEYLSPGVYVEDNPGLPVIEAVSSSTGGFMGVTQRGPVNKPVFITSWNAFLTNFALGCDSPFLKDSYLAYSIYGFFQNGGKRCYVMRVAGTGYACATAQYFETPDRESESVPKFTISAKDEGTWANGFKVYVKANEDDATLFDIVTLDGSGNIVEVVEGLSNSSADDNYWFTTLESMSDYIKAGGTAEAATLVAIEKDKAITLANGNDGATVTDTDFTLNLTKFDVADDMNLLCIPGETSDNVVNALLSYCENNKYLFAIVDVPMTTVTSTAAKTWRKKLSCKNAAIYYPWIKVTDPLSKTGKLKLCPACGHTMGVYARTIEERGVWKAPAGTEAIVRGAIATNAQITSGDTDLLNPAGVVSIMARPNYGIVLWGARDIHPDSSMKYISDVLLDINIKKSIYQGTQQFVFEPNDPETWKKLRTTVEAFLDNMWRDGALFGEKASEAYYVKCDEELNPENVRNAGKLICEVGYASKKPAEFVIFRFSHTVATQ